LDNVYENNTFHLSYRPSTVAVGGVVAAPYIIAAVGFGSSGIESSYFMFELLLFYVNWLLIISSLKDGWLLKIF